MTNSNDNLPLCHFRDAAGRVWDLTISLGAARRIDASDYSAVTSLSFTSLSPTQEFLLELMQNRRFEWAIIWTILQPQVAEKLGIDPVANYDQAEAEFVESIKGGEVKAAGTKALWEALSDFFRDEVTGLDVMCKQRIKACAMANDKIQQLEPEMDEVTSGLVDQEILKLKAELHKIA
jgi:hypothetical protein